MEGLKDTIEQVVDSVARLSDRIRVFDGPTVPEKEGPQGIQVSIESDVPDDVGNLYDPEMTEVAHLKQRLIEATHLAVFERAGVPIEAVSQSGGSSEEPKTYIYAVNSQHTQEEMQSILGHAAEEVRNLSPEERESFDRRVDEIFTDMHIPKPKNSPVFEVKADAQIAGPKLNS
ncbi:MAG TPA: hypothetical protein DEA55_06835 [Rhodospirillaceae bacterium]|nr:hypothetical protein [Rhodospirillaceae bacterium]